MHGNGGRHRVDAHIELGSLECSAASEGHHTGFGGSVVALFFLGAPTQHGSVVNNHTSLFPFFHDFHHVTGHAHGTVQGDIQYLVPFGVVHIHQQFGGAKTGVVDEHIGALPSCFRESVFSEV